MMEGILELGTVLSAIAGKDRAAEKTAKLENEKLTKEIHETCLRLEQIRAEFELVSDPDLVEAIIYDELATKARYRHLLQKAKEGNVTCQPF